MPLLGSALLLLGACAVRDHAEGDVALVQTAELESIDCSSLGMLQASQGACASVVVRYEGQATELKATESTPERATWKVVHAGAQVGTIALTASRGEPGALTSTLTADDALEGTKRFEYGIVLVSKSLRPIDSVRGVVEGRQERYYPYRWAGSPCTRYNQPETACKCYSRVELNGGDPEPCDVPVDLASPGVIADGTFWIEDTEDLTRIELVPSGERMKAVFLDHRPTRDPDNWDIASSRHPLTRGGRLAMTIRFSKRLASLHNERFGAASRLPEGRMTQIQFKYWAGKTADGHTLSPDQYGQFARELGGKFNYVIIRTLFPELVEAAAFRERGISLIRYMYFGGVRIGSADEQQVRDHDAAHPDRPWVLKQGGQDQRAPVAGGNWLLLDLRDQQARRFLIGCAVDSIKLHGFDGIYLDNGPFWTGRSSGNNARVGGQSSMVGSYAAARVLYLRELRSALRTLKTSDWSSHHVAPEPFVGALANQSYVDQLHGVDFVLIEGLGFRWVKYAEPAPTYDPAQKETRHFELVDTPTLTWSSYRANIRNHAVIGSKGPNALLVQSSLQWALARMGVAPEANGLREARHTYLEHGDFQAQNDDNPKTASYREHDGTLSMARRLASLGAHVPAPGAYFSSIEAAPSDAGVVATSPSQLSRVPRSGPPSSGRVTLNLSRALPMLQAGRATPEFKSTLTLNNSVAVTIAERKNGPWFWTALGFAYRGAELFARGAVELTAPPRSTEGTGLVTHTFQVEPSIGDDGVVPPDATLHVRTPRAPISVRRNGEGHPFCYEAGDVVVTFSGPSTIAIDVAEP